jgi:hypothetical protein
VAGWVIIFLFNMYAGSNVGSKAKKTKVNNKEALQSAKETVSVIAFHKCYVH